MPFRSGSNTTLNLDITLPSLLAASSLATIVEELLKNLLAQRHQIPQTYQLLKREVQNLSSSSSALAHHEEDDELNPRRRVRLRQERLKREKLDTRFSSVAGSFVDQFEHLAEEMRMEISSHASLIQSVCFIFGATPVSPKEVYHVVFPETMLEDFEKAHDASTPEQKHTKRATLQLFRSMVMHPELFDLLGKPLRPSNVFVAIKKKLGKGESSTTSSGWIPKPEYANLHRGRVTEFRLHNRPSDVDGEKAKRKKKSSACRNLMFTNDLLETPARNAKEDVTPVFDTYTPIPMDLCTPFLARSRAATQSVPLLPSSVGEKESIPICVEMTETPCVKRTPWTQGRLSSTHGESNSHCTPLFERRSWTNEATPREDKCFEWFISSRAIKGFKDPRILNAMFPDVHSVLKLDQRDLRGVTVNILEEREQSGSFLIHHFLSHGLKSGKNVLFLGLEQSFGHYHVAGMKLGNNLQKARESGQVVFIEGLKMIGEAYSKEKAEDGQEFNFLSSDVEEPLKNLFIRVRKDAEALLNRGSNKELLIIVDKLSILGTLGLSPFDLAVFAKYLHQLTVNLSANLVTLTRADPEDESSKELTIYLLENFDLSIWTWPLKTGKSSLVSGNIKFQWLAMCEEGRYQYSVDDKSVKVFALGASNAVL